MFKREIRMKIVNPKKETQLTAESDITLEKKLAVASYYAERFIRQAGKAALTYVAVDTLRQVIVAKASK